VRILLQLSFSNKKILLPILKYCRFKLGLKCGYSIPLNTCGKGLCLAHIGPVVISNYAKIGDYCRIHIDVNIRTDARNGKAAPYNW
jgi:serine O-acetyltransferase